MKHETDVKERVVWVDTAKGIGIFLVVLGHMAGIVPEVLVKIIYAFHMPLFFYLSGVVYKNKPKYFSKCSKRVLSRYVILAIVFSIIYSLLVGREIVVREELKNVLFGQGYDVGNPATILWFLLCMYSVKIIYNFIDVHVKNQKYRIIIVFFLVILGVLYNSLFKVPLPLRIQTALVALLFYWIGTKASEKWSEKYIIGNTKLLTCAAVTVGIGLANQRIDMATDNYSLVPFFFVGSLAGIISVVNIATRVQVPLLEVIGRYSLIIYVLHVFIPCILKLIEAKYVESTGGILTVVNHLCSWIIMGVIIYIKYNLEQKYETKVNNSNTYI